MRDSEIAMSEAPEVGIFTPSIIFTFSRAALGGRTIFDDIAKGL